MMIYLRYNIIYWIARGKEPSRRLDVLVLGGDGGKNERCYGVGDVVVVVVVVCGACHQSAINLDWISSTLHDIIS